MRHPMALSKEIKFRRKILSWGTRHRSRLPWRTSSQPFEVLVAEVLLRKTSRRQVASIYRHLLNQYPSPRSIAHAAERDIVNTIRPLGMQHLRAAGLKKMARQLQQEYGGAVPET